MSRVREEPVTAHQLMEEMDPAVLKRVVNAMVYLMKEKFIEMVKQRQIYPREIYRDSEVASRIAELLFNDEKLSMEGLDNYHLDHEDVLRLAQLILQMTNAM